MSNPTEIEAALFLLRDFLQKEKDRERRGATIEALHDRLESLHKKNDAQNDQLESLHKKSDAHDRRLEIVVRDQIEQGLRIDRYGKRLRKMEKKVYGDPDSEGLSAPVDEETTGSFRIVEAQKAIELAELRRRTETLEIDKREKREDELWWKRWWVGIVGALLLALFSASCSGAGSLVFWWLSKK